MGISGQGCHFTSPGFCFAHFGVSGVGPPRDFPGTLGMKGAGAVQASRLSLPQAGKLEVGYRGTRMFGYAKDQELRRQNGILYEVIFIFYNSFNRTHTVMMWF